MSLSVLDFSAGHGAATDGLLAALNFIRRETVHAVAGTVDSGLLDRWKTTNLEEESLSDPSAYFHSCFLEATGAWIPAACALSQYCGVPATFYMPRKKHTHEVDPVLSGCSQLPTSSADWFVL